MDARFLTYFDPKDLDLRHFVDREAEAEALTTRVKNYLSVPDRVIGRTRAVLGDKSSGKSIFTREVIRQVCAEHSGDTLVVTIDCRRQRNRRDLLRKLISGLATELESLRDARAPVADGLVETARIVRDLASFDDAERSLVQSNVEKWSAAARLAGSRKVLGTLQAEFGLALERSAERKQVLTGKIRIDDDRLIDLVEDLVRDIRAHELEVVVYLDNVDEYDHDYSGQDKIDSLRRDVESLLRLGDMPLGLLLNMRSYFGASVLRREVDDITTLGPLAPADRVAMLERRLELENTEVRSRTKAARDHIEALAAATASPLAFLVGFKWFYERGALAAKEWEGQFDDYLRGRHPQSSSRTSGPSSTRSSAKTPSSGARSSSQRVVVQPTCWSVPRTPRLSSRRTSGRRERLRWPRCCGSSIRARAPDVAAAAGSRTRVRPSAGRATRPARLVHQSRRRRLRDPCTVPRQRLRWTS